MPTTQKQEARVAFLGSKRERGPWLLRSSYALLSEPREGGDLSTTSCSPGMNYLDKMLGLTKSELINGGAL